MLNINEPPSRKINFTWKIQLQMIILSRNNFDKRVNQCYYYISGAFEIEIEQLYFLSFSIKVFDEH